jgi:TatA/E family protein of Tat protein translocase
VFGISGFELLIIVVFVMIIFGPDKMPEIARTIGKAMRAFKSAQEDMERVIKAEMYAGDQAKVAKVDVETQTKAAASQAAEIWAATEDEDENEEEDEE